MKKLGFIGMGNMASAILNGMIQSHFMEGHQICAYDIVPSQLDKIKTFGVELCQNELAVVENSEMIFVAVKPQVVEKVLLPLKEALKDQVQDVKISSRLKSHPVCLVSGEGVSFEMEKVLNQMPDGQNIKAGRILEINPNHAIFTALQTVFDKDKEKINDYASLLYDQALLIEGFSIDDPVAFSNKVCQLMVDANK